ncbi:MAG: hypothetical protein ABIQ06_07325 [Caldimonas sp.]
METSKALLIVGAAWVIGGCGSSPHPVVTPLAAAAPRPAGAPAPAAAASCAMATQSANTCQVKTRFFTKRLICEVFAGGTPDQPFVYPYQLDVPVTEGMPVIVVWKLLDPGYQFVDKNSGPTQPGSSADFSDGDTTDDTDGIGATSRPERRYRWKFDHPGRAGNYKYDMRFQVKDPLDGSKWVTVTCDPTIKSSAD